MFSRNRRLLAALLLLVPPAAGPGCAALGAGPSGGSESRKDRLPAGTWGGPHVTMEVTETGARLDYDCAHGTIDEPVRLDDRGRFDVGGTHTPESPGPVRRGETRTEAARYTGSVRGDRMSLTVTRPGSGRELGTFELQRGRLGRVFKCG